jgi:hypothetical protein
VQVGIGKKNLDFIIPSKISKSAWILYAKFERKSNNY